MTNREVPFQFIIKGSFLPDCSCQRRIHAVEWQRGQNVSSVALMKSLYCVKLWFNNAWVLFRFGGGCVAEGVVWPGLDDACEGAGDSKVILGAISGENLTMASLNVVGSARGRFFRRVKKSNKFYKVKQFTL